MTGQKNCWAPCVVMNKGKYYMYYSSLDMDDEDEHGQTIEGAFYFCVGSTHFLMYLGVCYQNPTYFIGYSIAHGEADEN